MIDWSSCPDVERTPERVSGAWVFRCPKRGTIWNTQLNRLYLRRSNADFV